MAVLPIVEAPDPILSERAAEVEEVTPEIRQLIQDMADTMFAAPGVGLAAPQVNRGLRIIVADLDLADPEASYDDEEYEEGSEDEAEEETDGEGEEFEETRELYVIVNPVIVAAEGSCTFEEGCLSLPEFTIDVKRSERLVVQGLDPDGEPLEIEAWGFPAVVLQHEIDHLNGITLLNKAGLLSRKLFLKKQKKKRANAAAAD